MSLGLKDLMVKSLRTNELTRQRALKVGLGQFDKPSTPFPGILESLTHGKIPARSLGNKDLEVKYPGISKVDAVMFPT